MEDGEKELPRRECRKRCEGRRKVHSVGFTELRGEDMPCESRETVQQRRSGVGRIEQLEDGEGWVTGVCDFLPGQQMWRVGEVQLRQVKLLPAPQLLPEGACRNTLSLVG
jgi:hypothetical protein